MPMTDTQETCTRSRYRFTRNRCRFTRNWYQKNWYLFLVRMTCSLASIFSGTRFWYWIEHVLFSTRNWYQFLVQVSWAFITGITQVVSYDGRKTVAVLIIITMLLQLLYLLLPSWQADHLWWDSEVRVCACALCLVSNEAVEAVCQWKSSCVTNSVLRSLPDVHNWHRCRRHTQVIWVGSRHCCMYIVCNMYATYLGQFVRTVFGDWPC